MDKTTDHPTSTDLLLAHYVLTAAQGRRSGEIRRSSETRLSEEEFNERVENWEIGLETYIRRVSDELHLTWRVMSGEQIKLR